MWVFFLPQSHKDRDALNVRTSARSRVLLSGKSQSLVRERSGRTTDLASYLRIEREFEAGGRAELRDRVTLGRRAPRRSGQAVSARKLHLVRMNKDTPFVAALLDVDPTSAN